MLIIIIITVMIIIDYLSQEAELSSDVMGINDYYLSQEAELSSAPLVGLTGWPTLIQAIMVINRTGYEKDRMM